MTVFLRSAATRKLWQGFESEDRDRTLRALRPTHVCMPHDSDDASAHSFAEADYTLYLYSLMKSLRTCYYLISELISMIQPTQSFLFTRGRIRTLAQMRATSDTEGHRGLPSHIPSPAPSNQCQSELIMVIRYCGTYSASASAFRIFCACISAARSLIRLVS